MLSRLSCNKSLFLFMAQAVIPGYLTSDGTFVPFGGTSAGGSNVNIAQVGGSTLTLGQQLAAASLPVVLTAIQIASLASSANQITELASLASIDTNVAKTIPATTAAAVTPSDSTALTSRAVWVGGAGDVSVRLSGATSTTVVFTAVPAGTLLPISVVRVMAATTATNINVLN